MIIEVKVPQLSESVSEATLVSWHAQEGEAVKRDQNLIDIETDKVVLETPAPADGVIVKIIKRNGETVASGEVIAQLDTEAKAGVVPAAAASPAPAATGGSASPAATVVPGMGPAARKILAEKGADAASVQGSGPGGRVTKSDALGLVRPASGSSVSAPAVSAPAATAQTALPQPPVPPAVEAVLADRPEQRVPMSRLRARVAERLLQSQATNAILTTFNEVNMAPVMELRKKYVEKFEKEHGIKLGFMSFFVKAAVAALKKYPVLNASVEGNDIVYHLSLIHISEPTRPY